MLGQDGCRMLVVLKNYFSVFVLQLPLKILCWILFLFFSEFPQPRSQTMNKGMNYPDKENLYEQQMARTAEQYPEEKLSIQ